MNTRSSKLCLAAILDTSIGRLHVLATVIMTVHLQPPMEFADHLARYHGPAFDERVEAWEKGPVVPAVRIADLYEPPPPLYLGEPAEIAPEPVPESVLNVVTNVVAYYGTWSWEPSHRLHTSSRTLA